VSQKGDSIGGQIEPVPEDSGISTRKHAGYIVESRLFDGKENANVDL
jgi:hypothetical protein